MAAIVAVPLALILGMLAALYRNTIFDRLINVATLTAISSPEFFIAYILCCSWWRAPISSRRSRPSMRTRPSPSISTAAPCRP
jgi:ABC-type dipeptide/oligopeptide/nickel transport systems, permease components